MAADALALRQVINGHAADHAELTDQVVFLKERFQQSVPSQSQEITEIANTLSFYMK